MLRWLKKKQKDISRELYNCIDQIEENNLKIEGYAPYSTSLQNDPQDVRNATTFAKNIFGNYELNESR